MCYKTTTSDLTIETHGLNSIMIPYVIISGIIHVKVCDVRIDKLSGI